MNILIIVIKLNCHEKHKIIVIKGTQMVFPRFLKVSNILEFNCLVT
jgi:hypothetical protein